MRITAATLAVGRGYPTYVLWKTSLMPYTTIHGKRDDRMQRQTARIGKNNRAQVVTIPLEFRFPETMKEVFIRKMGEDVVLSPRPTDWSAFLATGPRASDDFMADIEDLPVQERTSL